MTLIIGGAFSGRHEFLRRSGGGTWYDVQKKDAFDFYDEISSFLADEKIEVQSCLSKVVERISSFDFVIATEVGCGIVPLKEEDRKFRDANGKLNQALARIADKVVLCTLGIGRVIKDCGARFGGGTGKRCVIFRHGQTLSNAEKRFAGGGTDVPLSEEGILQAERRKTSLASDFSLYEERVRKAVLSPGTVFVSPMRRAIDTAKILFGESSVVVEEGLCEMRMGLFENMTHEELLSGLFADGSKSPSNAALYQKWLDSAGTMECPSSASFAGESIETFSSRVSAAFERIKKMSGDEPLVIVAHGGVQMALCHQFFKKAALTDIPYFKWQSDNASFRFGEVF